MENDWTREIAKLRAELAANAAVLARLRAQRDALLAACRTAEDWIMAHTQDGDGAAHPVAVIRSALALAEKDDA